MANPVSSLREANNYVEIEGFLEENNLEKKVLDEGTDKERKIIAGNLVIGVSEEAKYKVEFFANEKNANGDESKIYKGLETLGFSGGNILEPAMGVGNFFGVMPEEMRKESRLHGVEIDSITGRIAKQPYSENQRHNRAYM